MTSCSIHVADSGIVGFLRSRHPKPDDVPGLVSSQRLTAAAFSGKQTPGAPQLGRNGFLAFWENEGAIDNFLASPAGDAWNDGWNVNCDVTRAIGSWPGLPEDVDRDVKTDSDHPVIGISLGPLRLSRGARFNKLNTAVEAQFLESDGVIWASAFFALPRTLCTITFWESAAALHRFARTGAHVEAMKASVDPEFDPSLPNGTNFFEPALFMSLRPTRTLGSLTGKNPLPKNVFSATAADAE